MPFRSRYHKNNTRTVPKIIRAPIPEDEKIPGSFRWAKSKAKSKGEVLKKPITRNSLKFERKQHTGIDYNSIAYSNGWDYDHDTKSWSHPQYPDKKFPSIIQGDGLPIPYGNHNDLKGQGFVYDTSNAGEHITIRQNKWISEEFDTRRGRRRTLWEKKKEEKRKFLSSREQREEMMEEFEHENEHRD